MTNKHYKIVKFYRRQYERKVATLSGALAVVQAAGLTQPGESYTEVWEMDNDEDGSLVSIFDSDGNVLHLANPAAALANYRARLIPPSKK